MRIPGAPLAGGRGISNGGWVEKRIINYKKMLAPDLRDLVLEVVGAVQVMAAPYAAAPAVVHQAASVRAGAGEGGRGGARALTCGPFFGGDVAVA